MSGTKFDFSERQDTVNSFGGFAKIGNDSLINIWSQAGPDGYNIVGQITSADGSRGSVFTVAHTGSEPPTNTFGTPLYTLENGNVAVSYGTEAGFSANIINPSGTVVGQTVSLAGTMSLPVYDGYSEIHPLVGGGFVVTRLEHPSLSPGPIAATAFDAQGNPLGATYRAQSDFAEYHVQDVVALSDAGWLMLWKPPGGGLVAQRFAASGAPSGETYSVSGTTGYIRWVSDVSSTRLQDGRIAVAWSEQDPGTQAYGIHVRLLDTNGVPIGENQLITDATHTALSPTVTATAEGYAVSWLEGSFGYAWDAGWNTSLHAQTFDLAGHPSSAPQTIATGTYGLYVAAAPTNGGVAYTWSTHDADGRGVGFAALDATGTIVAQSQLLSGEQQAGRQDPAFKALSLGDTVYVGWTDMQTQQTHLVRAEDATTVPCYVTGTEITTGRGEIAVENLRIGDRVVTISGEERAVMWIGHRTIDCRKATRPAEVRPVRIVAGAFAPGLPRRDLLVSPDHAVFFDDVLVPAKALINGSTIRQVEAGQVTYYGIELDSHDMVLAEGVAAETYLDDGQRDRFDNYEGDGSDLDRTRAFTRGGSYRPLRWEGPQVAAVRAWIDARARQLGKPPVYGLDASDADADPVERTPVVGYLETVSREAISGWAWVKDRPNDTAVPELVLDGTVMATFAADQYRPDLEKARIGAGRHAFRLRLPPEAYEANWTHVGVRVRGSGQHLRKSPVLMSGEASEPLIRA